MRRSVFSAAGVLLAALLYLSLTVLADAHLAGVRVDLTEDDLYTLSEGSRHVARDLAEPVVLELYYSTSVAREIPAAAGEVAQKIIAHHQRVRQMLREYEAASEGKLRVVERDPEPFSAVEDEAVAAGLVGLPVNAAGDRLYFGLVARNALGEQEVIPFLDPFRGDFVEFEVSRFLAKLDALEKPVVGLVAGLPITAPDVPPMPGRPSPPRGWAVVDYVRERFEVRELELPLERVPEEIDLLWIVHPQQLDERTLYAVDQFVLDEGRALIFVDPHAEVDDSGRDPRNPMASMGMPRASDLGPLFHAWGLDYATDTVVGDLALAARVNAGSPTRPEILEYVVWLELGPEQIAEDEPSVSQLTSLNMSSAGVLAPSDALAADFTPLLHTTEQAMRIDAGNVRFFPDPKGLLRDYRPGGERLTLAARLDGVLPSAFPDGPPEVEPDPMEELAQSLEEDPGFELDDGAEADDPDAADEDSAPADGDADDGGTVDGDPGADTDAPATPEHLTESRGASHVVVVADVDMLDDSNWTAESFGLLTVAADNGSFVLNQLDALGGDPALLGIRGRKGRTRTFTELERRRELAEQRHLQEEQRLQQELAATERRLNELQSQREDGASLLLTPEQEQEIERFRAEQVATRQALRRTRAELRADVEGLEAWLKALNILGVPLLLLIVAGALVLARRRGARPS